MTKNTGIRAAFGTALAAAAVISLAACSGGSDPLGGASPGGSDSGEIIVGSAAFAENEIIAQIYAQALESRGVPVRFAGQIGQRDVYLTALEDGSLDLIPEYSGNLLQAFDGEVAENTPEAVASELDRVLPENLSVLEAAPAENKDSYNVTAEFSAEFGVTSLEDLAGLAQGITLGGNPELAKRPYGPEGLSATYGVDPAAIRFTPLSDSGGPLTSGALLDGTVTVADIYSTTPSIAENNFVTLADPKNLILPQNVIPLLSAKAATPEIAEAINAVSTALTTEDLIAMNTRNQGAEKASPRTIAADWLAEKKLI